jgi:hypothetical protein
MTDDSDHPRKRLLLEEQLAAFQASQSFIETMNVKAAATLRTPAQALQESRAGRIVSVSKFLQASLLLQRQSPQGLTLAAATALSADDLAALDFALAEGKITSETFVSVYNGRDTLESYLKPGALAVFGSLQLYFDALIIDGEKVPLAEITSVRFGTDYDPVKPPSQTPSTHCAIGFRKRSRVQLERTGQSLQSGGSLRDFAEALAEMSFKHRVNNFMRKVQTERRIQLSNDVPDGPGGREPAAFLSADGFIETETHRISLASAQAAGELQFAVNYVDVPGAGREFQPAEISLSPTRLTWHKSETDIVFTPTLADPDVVHFALRSIADRGKSSL